jgi:prolyl-tRNA synthetase
MEVVDTPDTPTIQTLAARLGVPASATLKNLLVTVTPPGGRSEVVAIGVPGDRDVDLRRVATALAPATVELFDDFVARPDLVRGYVGPQGLAGSAFRYYADPRVAPGTSWVTGSNQPDKHVRNVVAGRDFAVERYIYVVALRDGDPCPNCGAGLRLDRGIEIGHIFQLGRKYADAFGLDVLGPAGTPVRVTMGSYGVGVSRAVAAIAEQTHDDRGLCWPRSVAPADVHLVAAGRDDGVYHAAGGLADALAVAGLSVLYDDRRGVSPGVKFTDAELIGAPTIVVAGRGVARSVVEVQDRRSGAREDVPIEELVDRLARLVGEAM